MVYGRVWREGRKKISILQSQKLEKLHKNSIHVYKIVKE